MHVKRRGILTRVGDREAVGRLEVVHVVVEVERLLGGVLVGVVELHREPEGAVLLHRGAHEETPCKLEQGDHTTRIITFRCLRVHEGGFNSLFRDPSAFLDHFSGAYGLNTLHPRLVLIQTNNSIGGCSIFFFFFKRIYSHLLRPCYCEIKSQCSTGQLQP